MVQACLEHDPEKWAPVFGKRSCSNNKLERDDDSKKSHPALELKLLGGGRGWNLKMDTMSSSVAAAAGAGLGADRSLRHVPSSQGVSVLRPTDCPRLRSAQPDAGRACWYAVYTKPRRELRAQVQLSIQGFRTFLPRFRKTVRHARKLMTVSAPFFDRYLFVALDLDHDRWRSINGTFGVTGLVANRTGPIPLPPG